MTEPSEKNKGGPDGEVTRSGMPGYVVPLVVGVSVVSVIVVALKKSESPPSPGPAAPAGIESQYPTCHALGQLYLERNAELHCASDGFGVVKPICERVYREKPACESAVQAAATCLKAQPKTAWRCSDQGSLVFEAPECAQQMAAFSKCING